MKNSKTITPFTDLDQSWTEYLDQLDPTQKQLFLKLDQIGQLQILNQIPFSLDHARSVLQELQEIDEFFSDIGGIVGYQNTLKQIVNPYSFNKTILEAPYTNLDGTLSTHHNLVSMCLKQLPSLAEVYAVGGAADRLNLKSGEVFLPAACLKIAGKTLLEYLVQDLEAKEWLYYKLYRQTLTLPIVMMTSFEKNNQAHIYQILEQHQFFYRGHEKFLIFNQPLVPMVDQKLDWQVNQNSLFLKPGGHGAIWGLCQRHHVFEKLKEQGVKKLSIRQINNPIACVDFGHLAFLGLGFLKNADFGFFACERYAGSQEGINVLLKDKTNQFSLTNIEYCQLQSCGIEDVPDEKGLSQYPANTNVLFADLDRLKELTKQHPLPGKILNYKSFSWDGKTKELARLETMMQNMADFLVEPKSNPQHVYMTRSPRGKTISPVKKQKTAQGSYAETPEACFFDFMKNASELLTDCEIEHPKLSSIESYYKFPEFVLTYLPALGPMFDVIAQKCKGGQIKKGSYVNWQIAEMDWKQNSVKGAVSIKGLNPYGYHSSQRDFSEAVSRVVIHNCVFDNQGIDWENSGRFYQDAPYFKESFEVVLEGFSEFEARDVIFKGNYKFIVPDGHKLVVSIDSEHKLITKLSKISEPSWIYHYEWIEDRLCLNKRQSS